MPGAHRRKRRRRGHHLARRKPAGRFGRLIAGGGPARPRSGSCRPGDDCGTGHGGNRHDVGECSRRNREVPMAFDDKVDNKSEELGGKVKEGFGKATDDEQLEAEGKADQTSSNLKQAGEKIKDAFKS
jgi:uncharacterized protein YjbJ (UPF0337 family)